MPSPEYLNSPSDQRVLQSLASTLLRASIQSGSLI
jgi:hypothetical protein